MQLFSFFSSALAPQPAADLNKGPCVYKHCWYGIVAADTYLTFYHRSLATIVDAPEPLWHAGRGGLPKRHPIGTTGMDTPLRTLVTPQPHWSGAFASGRSDSEAGPESRVSTVCGLSPLRALSPSACLLRLFESANDQLNKQKFSRTYGVMARVLFKLAESMPLLQGFYSSKQNLCRCGKGSVQAHLVSCCCVVKIFKIQSVPKLTMFPSWFMQGKEGGRGRAPPRYIAVYSESPKTRLCMPRRLRNILHEYYIAFFLSSE